jgi:PAS domain S-box-containing protein
MVLQTIRATSLNQTVLDSGAFDGHALCAAIVQSCDDAIISCDLRGVIISWNQGAERLLGYSADEVLGTSIAALIPLEQQAEAAEVFNQLRKGMRVEPYETLRRRKDSSLAELSLTVSPIKDSSGNVVGISKIARDISDLKQTRNQLTVLLGEMRHRIRNFGAIIEALGRSSLPTNSPVTQSFFSSLMGRVRALLAAGEMVLASTQRHADLEEIAKTALQPFLDTAASRFNIGGPQLLVSEQAAGGLALAFHELATNALKHGALSAPDGTIDLTWTIDASAVRIVWKEHSRRALEAPTRRGFGRRLIETAVSSEPQSKTELLFEPDGLRCLMGFELRQTT